MRFRARLLRALGLLKPRHFGGSPEMAELLEAIRWEADVYDEVAEILSRVDLAELRRLEELYRDQSPAPGPGKYFEIATYVALQLRYARELGLAPKAAGSAQRVLDIGTGAGYFPFVCSHYGHTAAAIDLDETPMFNDMVRMLGIQRTTWRIAPFVPLPSFPYRFDCVTAMQIKFNSLPQGGRWGPGEWAFLLSDLANRTAHAEAQVFLGFNADSSGVAVQPELARFFSQRAAKVDRWKVRFRSLRAFATSS